MVRPRGLTVGVCVLLVVCCLSVAIPAAAGGDDKGGSTESTYCAQYVSDLNFPDYSYVAQGTWITKYWRIKNCGTVTWTTSYGVQKLWGNTCSSFNLTGSVAPGSTATIWVDCYIGSSSQYEAHFKMKNASGSTFGDEFWMIINSY